MRQTQKFTLSLLAAAVIAGNAHASGFNLFSEGSTVVIGNAGAGSAAEGFDAATSTYNPAALVLLKHPEVVGSGIGVVPNSEFTGTVTDTTTLSIIGLPDTSTTSGGPVNNYPFGENAFVPAFHMAYPFNENVVGALSVTAPFGLGTRYDENSNARYEATETKLFNVDISPAVAFRVNDMLSLGIGVDIEHANVDFDAVTAFPGVDLGVFPPAIGTTDYLIQNNAKDWGIGAHGGVLLMLREGATRLGLNYMSRVTFDLEGTSTTTGPGGPFINENASSHLTLPDSLVGSFYHEVNKSLALMGSLMWIHWDVFNEVRLENLALPNGPATAVTPQNYDNSYRAALGLNYRVNERFLIRAGGAFDQTPQNDVDRNLRLIDNDRWIAALGFRVDATSNLSFDVGYQHIFVEDTTVNHSSTSVANPLPGVTITQNINAIGTVRNAAADLIGVQVRYQMS